MALALPSIGAAQTYDVGGASPDPGQKSKPQKSDDAQQQNKSDFSWGAGIDVARQARAAQDALKRNDYAAAVSYAQQAANSAPQNAELWFLLGYAARLNEKYSLSVDSYNRGLKQQPNSIRGLAGLAQTYAKMGRVQDAEELLRRVVDANPKDANSLQLAGELLLASDPKASLTFLERASALQPSPHNDLLIAHAYDRMGQPEESARYLNRAKSKAPHDPEVLRAVAGQFRDQGKYDEAISTLQSISTKNLRHPSRTCIYLRTRRQTTGVSHSLFAPCQVCEGQYWFQLECRAGMGRGRSSRRGSAVPGYSQTD